MSEYCSRSLLTDKEIYYQKDERKYKGRVIGIDQNANLLIETNGIIEKLSHGEIQIVGMEQLLI